MQKKRYPRDRLREIWRGVIRRCEDKSCKDYHHYHDELHVTVCQEWHDFDVFKQWALTHGYREDLTLDRVNNRIGYRPNNCRWISRKAQAQNRATCIRVNVNGTVKTLSEWGKTNNIPKDVITRRMERGWSAEKAVTTPVKKQNKKSNENLE